MRVSVFAFIVASAATKVHTTDNDLVELRLRSFNESCNALADSVKCETTCMEKFTECLSKCEDDANCRSLCNREQTTCIDRCPCHDKCSWGCPCGFYQCTPKCEVC